MNSLIGNLVYGLCAVIAVIFVVGAGTVFIAGLSDSPALASGFAISIALLFLGFGWSSRRMLTGQI